MIFGHFWKIFVFLLHVLLTLFQVSFHLLFGMFDSQRLTIYRFLMTEKSLFYLADNYQL